MPQPRPRPCQTPGLRVSFARKPGNSPATRWIPTFSGRAARRALVRQWGLPNACPREGESAFAAGCRLLFVDDDNDGAPVAYWIPGRED